MASTFHTQAKLLENLVSLGVEKGDGLFVHASLKAIGRVVGGPKAIVETLMEAVGEDGLVGMPAFSTDASFPADFDRADLSADQIAEAERAVLGFDVDRSLTSGVGIIAETFRTFPGTLRSAHPTVSVCLNGRDAKAFLVEHSLAWATGELTPLGKLRDRRTMKILLIGVGWNRCSALHTAETLASHRRTKTRRFKSGGTNGSWLEAPDVADDMNRLFPSVGEAFQGTGAVSTGSFGKAQCRICDYRGLVDFAVEWIGDANKRSGETA